MPAGGTLFLGTLGSVPVEMPPPPERLRTRLERIGEAGAAGNIEAAVTLAADLEHDVGSEFGRKHPYTLQARAVRATSAPWPTTGHEPPKPMRT